LVDYMEKTSLRIPKMRQRLLFTIALIAASGAIALPLVAQSQAQINPSRQAESGTPSPPELIAQSPTQINQLRRTDGIAISGRVVSIVGNNFVVEDGTGRVIVDAGPRWYRQVNLQPNEQITVIGELDDDDFDAFSIRRADGSVIQIRSPQGPPPWAGGRDRNRGANQIGN
jgi:uncharacterized protein YdeI (BOF family)